MPGKIVFTVFLALFIILGGCSSKTPQGPEYPPVAGKKKPATQRPYVINHKTYYPIPTAKGYREQGVASWYGRQFHGRKTANGERYDMYAHTAAHKTLPMNTMLVVKNLRNGKSTLVRINDRGPFVRRRIIDLSYTAARELGIIKNGTAEVVIVALAEQEEPPAPQPAIQQAPPQEQIGEDFDKGRFYIQVGAFEYKDNARKLAKKFAARGRDVVIQQYPAAGISLYRVLVFSGTSLKKARLYETFLEHNGYRDALVIARD